MTLFDDDLAILKSEGCLVDAEAAAKAACLNWDEYDRADCLALTNLAAAVLRADGLEPGMPALHLLVAACERRGWFPALDHQSDGTYIGAVVTQKPERGMRDWRLGANPATALALAFCQAVRAVRDAERATE